MKKRIFIATHYLEIGGAESSLIGMLQSIDYSRVDVDLFLYAHRGAFLRLLPKEVHLLPEIPEYACTSCSASECFKRGQYLVGLAQLAVRVRLGLYARLKHPKTYSTWFTFMGQILTHVLPDVGSKDEYDLAIGFVDPHNFILDHVRARRKVGWIHTDYSTIDVHVPVESKVWRRLDHPISISQAVTDSFVAVFPSERDKVVEIENILSPQFVKQRAGEFFPAEYLQFRKSGIPIFCTAGRLTAQKNYQNFPYIIKELADRGIAFHWFAMGPGDPSSYLSLARKLGVEQYLTFLGPRENPYPYIKHCTVYLQPSLWEGKSVAVREAQILERPVLITNYGTASSQVKDGLDGVIVPMDNKGIADGIANLVNDQSLQRRIVDYLKRHDYGNEKEVEKIYRLMDD